MGVAASAAPFALGRGTGGDGRNRRITDVVVTGHRLSGLATLTPISDRARQWFDANVVTESWQWFGDELMVEPRLAENIVDAIVDNGMEVRRQ